MGVALETHAVHGTESASRPENALNSTQIIKKPNGNHGEQVDWIGPFVELGYLDRLVPIIPPGAPLSSRSSLAKRLAAGDDCRGKAPGLKTAEGSWIGFADWRIHPTTAADAARWTAMGAGCGIRCGEGLAAIDVDCVDEKWTDAIEADANARSPVPFPRRIGRAPKSLLLCRTDPGYAHSYVEFENKQRVEILSGGRQFVAGGIHPVTGSAYRWTRPLVRFEELPFVAGADLDALMEWCRATLPGARTVKREGGVLDGTPIDQEALRAAPERLALALAGVANAGEAWASREAYVAMGHAIKAAVGDDGGGLAMFQEWCARWEGGENDPEIVAADWRRMRPPFRRGADWIFKLAGASGGEKWFEEVPPVEIETEPTPPKRAWGAHAYAFPEPSAIPPRSWLYGGHYIRRFLSATIAQSKVGKSTLAVAEALAMASGKPLLGVEPKGKFRVWWWNGEDPREEMERRVAAAMKFHGLTREDVDGRLFLDSGRDMSILLASQGKAGATIDEKVVAALKAEIVGNELDVVIIDPFISAHRVSENDNNAIDAVAKTCARIADETRCAFEIVHHTRKLGGAGAGVEDGRGASSLLGATRSMRALSSMTAPEGRELGIGNEWRSLFRFSDISGNMAILDDTDGDSQWMRKISVNLENGVGEDMLDKIANGDRIGVAAPVNLKALRAKTIAKDPELAREAAIAAVGAFRWRSDPRAQDWIGVPIADAFGLDVETDKTRIKDVVRQLIKDGLLSVQYGVDAHRKTRTWLELAKNKPSA